MPKVKAPNCPKVS